MFAVCTINQIDPIDPVDPIDPIYPIDPIKLDYMLCSRKLKLVFARGCRRAGLIVLRAIRGRQTVDFIPLYSIV